MTAIPIVALDVPDSLSALGLVDRLGGACRFYKIGSELFTAEGPRIVAEVRGRGCDVFLDLKFHDIPNTVRSAAAAAAAQGVRLLTVHAEGGEAMVRAAVEGAGAACGVLAVTVLTSLDAPAVAAGWGRDPGTLVMETEVLRLAELAAGAGARGIVCSGQEARAVRARFAARLELLIPGIRLAGGEAHDQARVVTPTEAKELGATYVVLGRAVTRAADPVSAMQAVSAELEQ